LEDDEELLREEADSESEEEDNADQDSNGTSLSYVTLRELLS